MTDMYVVDSAVCAVCFLRAKTKMRTLSLSLHGLSEIINIWCVLCVLPVSHQLSWSVSVCTPPPKLLINSPYLCCWQHSYQKHVRPKDSILWTNGIPKECENTGGLVVWLQLLLLSGELRLFPVPESQCLLHSHKTVSLFRRSGNEKFPNQWWQFLHNLCLSP